MSHDIRTPINGICGMVNMAEHYADDMEKQTEYRTKVKEASNLLLELVNDVLDMDRAEIQMRRYISCLLLREVGLMWQTHGIRAPAR